jgi:sugar/nucleoside kinase (ribokinase family)
VRFVAVGDVMVDVVCSELPPPGARVHAEVSIRAGGSAVNAAVAAVSVGASAAVIGRVGNDPAAQLVRSELEELGVGAHLARDQDLPTGTAVSLGPDPSSPSVVASRGANARLSREDIPDLLEIDAMFVSGFALFQAGSAEGARTALDRSSGAWAAIDLSSPALASAARDVDFGDLRTRRIVVLATADEARAMTGQEPEDAARTLASRFSVACIKLGEDGALGATGDRVERRAVEPVARRSPLGAGDAFGSALLIALAEGAPLGRALDFACQAGARVAGSSR